MTPAPHLKLSRLRRAQPGDGAPAAPRPEPPAPADGPHPGSADLGRRLAESAFAQLAPLWSAARGNPSDPFGGSLGGLSATGTVTDRQFGRYLPVFWGELDLRAQRVLARHLCDTNPFAIGFLQLLKGYHVRTGFGWQACLKGQKKGAYSTAGGGDPLVAKAQNVLDAFRDRSQWPLKSREAFLRWRRDGEVFVRFGSGGYGRLPWVRFVDPEQVGSPVGDTGTGASFGIETEDGDHETPLRYHVWDADDPTSGEWVDAGRVIHLRANVDSGVKRGVTDFYALSEALDNTRRLLHTMLATAVKQARVAWVEKIAGTQQQALSAPEYAATATNRLQPYQVVDDFTRALSDQFGRFGIGGQHLSDVRRVEGSRQFEPGPAANSAGYIQVEQAALRACGVRWNFPEYFSGDASNNNMASSIVAGSPFTVTVEGNQLEFGHGFERPCALKVLELARDAGVLSWDEWRRLDVEVTEPAVATPDPLKDTQVYTSQLQAKIVSLDTVRQKLGYDPRHEAEGVKKDAAEQAPPAPPGGDGPPGGAGDGAQLPPDDGGGGGLGDPLGESAEYVTEGLYALLSEADRSHLVPKQITDKLGRKRTVYVRPDEQVAAQKARGDAFRAANAGLNPKEVLQKRKADAEPARQAARAEYAKAVSDPANYDPEAMAQHLERLTRDELREHARAVQARIGGLKSELVGRLLDSLKRQAPAKEEPTDAAQPDKLPSQSDNLPSNLTSQPDKPEPENPTAKPATTASDDEILQRLVSPRGASIEDTDHPRYQELTQAADRAHAEVRARFRDISKRFRELMDPDGALGIADDGASATHHIARAVRAATAGESLPNRGVMGDESGRLLPVGKGLRADQPTGAVVARAKKLAAELGTPVVPMLVKNDSDTPVGWALVQSPVDFPKGRDVSNTVAGMAIDTGDMMFHHAALPKDYRNGMLMPFDGDRDYGTLALARKYAAAATPRRRGDETAPTEDEFAAASAPAPKKR